MGVTKTVCGAPEIAKILLDQGIHMLADSKLVNLQKMRDAGIKATFVLLRSPSLSEIDSVIKNADISINTEISVIRKLSEAALEYNTVQKIILMIEMGDLREGIMPENLETFILEVLKLQGRNRSECFWSLSGISRSWTNEQGHSWSRESRCTGGRTNTNIGY